MGGEALRIERLKVVHAFADPEEPDGQVELAAKGGDGPAAGAAVELGDHDAGRAHRRREELALLYRVLAHGAVEHEQGLVWRAGQSPRRDADAFADLVHQALLRVQPPRGVDDDSVESARLCG